MEEWIYEMDKDWQQALTRIKPSLRESEEIRAAFLMGNGMSWTVEMSLEEYSRCPWLAAVELEQVKDDLKLAKRDLRASLRELLLLITDGEMEMADGERLERIDEMATRIGLVVKFATMRIVNTDGLIADREQQAANDAYLKSSLQ
jgi:hypothetical protein